MTKEELQENMNLLEQISELQKEFSPMLDDILSEQYSLSLELRCLYNEIRKKILDFLYSNSTKHLLRLIGNYLSKVALRFQHLQDSIFHSISILFGMCSSRPSYIFAAIFGSSSTRIFS